MRTKHRYGVSTNNYITATVLRQALKVIVAHYMATRSPMFYSLSFSNPSSHGLLSAVVVTSHVLLMQATRTPALMKLTRVTASRMTSALRRAPPQISKSSSSYSPSSSNARGLMASMHISVSLREHFGAVANLSEN
jgi:hypothetical protein